MGISQSIYNRNIWNVVKDGTVGYNSYNSALGFNLVTIRPNTSKWTAYKRADDKTKQKLSEYNKIITGVMTNEFTYGLNSEWETISTPLDLIDIGVIGDAFVAAGGGTMGAVYKSKKYWKKSGTLTITPTIRIIDVNGTGLPLEVARVLLMFCTASTGGLSSKLNETVNTFKSNLTAAANSKLDNLNNKAQQDLNNKDSGVLTKTAAAIEIGTAYVGKVAVNGTDEMLEDIVDAFTAKYAPPPLIVEIGKIFSHNEMILTNVSMKFSKEVTRKGPMYIDVDLTLETRKIINGLDSTGMTGVNSVGSIEIIGAGSTIENGSNIPVR